MCDRLASPRGEENEARLLALQVQTQGRTTLTHGGTRAGPGGQGLQGPLGGAEAGNTGEDNGEVGGRQTRLEGASCRFQAGKQSYTSQLGSVVLKCSPRTGTSGITWALLRMTEADRVKLENRSFGTRGMYYPRTQTVHASDCGASESARRGAWVQVTEVSEAQGTHRLEERRVATTYVEHRK